MGSLKKAGEAVMSFMGTIAPSISFIMVLITFMIPTCSRCLFRSAVTWSYEVSVLGYMWTTFFGMGKATETDERVVFGLAYDALKLLEQFMCKMICNIFLLTLLLFCFAPCVRTLLGRQMVTGVLKLPYTVVLAPFVYMLTGVIVHVVISIVKTVEDYKQTKEGTV